MYSSIFAAEARRQELLEEARRNRMVHEARVVDGRPRAFGLTRSRAAIARGWVWAASSAAELRCRAGGAWARIVLRGAPAQSVGQAPWGPCDGRPVAGNG